MKTRYALLVLAGFAFLMPGMAGAPPLRLGAAPLSVALPPLPKTVPRDCVLELSGLSARRPVGLAYKVSVRAAGRAAALGALSFYDVAGITGHSEPVRFALPPDFCRAGLRLTIRLEPSEGRFAPGAEPHIGQIAVKF